jgi:hypothetical protein
LNSKLSMSENHCWNLGIPRLTGLETAIWRRKLHWDMELLPKFSKDQPWIQQRVELFYGTRKGRSARNVVLINAHKRRFFLNECITISSLQWFTSLIFSPSHYEFICSKSGPLSHKVLGKKEVYILYLWRETCYYELWESFDFIAFSAIL